MRKTLILISLLALSGCPYDPDRIIRNPQIENIVGVWEGRGLYGDVPYSLVEIQGNSTGVVVFAHDDGAEVVATLTNFIFAKADFSFDWVPIGDQDKDEIMTIKANLVYGQLCVIGIDGEEDIEIGPLWCFVRKDKIEKYEKDASEAYESFKSKNV